MVIAIGFDDEDIDEKNGKTPTFSNKGKAKLHDFLCEVERKRMRREGISEERINEIISIITTKMEVP